MREAGFGIKLIEMPCVKPIDRDAIICAGKECGLIFTMEDNNIFGGLGSAVSEVIAETGGAIVKRLGLQDEFAQSGDCEELLDFYGFDEDAIVETVKKAMESKG